jgi:hypothetical protein
VTTGRLGSPHLKAILRRLAPARRRRVEQRERAHRWSAKTPGVSSAIGRRCGATKSGKLGHRPKGVRVSAVFSVGYSLDLRIFGILVQKLLSFTEDSMSNFDPKERAAEKQAARDADERALHSGEKSQVELRRENSAFAFVNARVSLKGQRAPK